MNRLLSFLCSIFIFIAMIFQGGNVYAKNATLNSITISDNQNFGYNIVLNIDKAAQYKSQKISNNKGNKIRKYIKIIN